MARKRTVVLDAMGVIFRAQDDVAELLVPFLKSRGSTTDEVDVITRYREASLGNLDVDEFWRGLGLSSSVEDEYLALHELQDGVLSFLEFARNEQIDVWCLSNDVSRWSRKLRQHFDLVDLFVGFVISGEIGARKPCARVYRCLIDQIGYAPDLFVDDRADNVSGAEKVGIRSVLFGTSDARHTNVSDFEALKSLVHEIPPE